MIKIPVLKIRDENGNFIPINAIRGENGKSAYEQAKEGGYKGTEEEFIAMLNGLTAEEMAPMYGYGTTDLTIGSSELETGKLYFVYE